MIYSGEYKLTQAGERLFKTLIDPEHLGKNVTELCDIAEVSRPTYYKLMNEEAFTTMVSDTSKEIVMSRMGEVFIATHKQWPSGQKKCCSQWPDCTQKSKKQKRTSV